jgi:hemerythrin-like metal-binding protein
MPMSPLPDTLKVGVESIDRRHEEFWELYEVLKTSSNADFTSLFEAVIQHTQKHFAEEEADMDTIEYANKSEHEQEHKKALEEMNYFSEKAKSGKLMFAKAYVNERLLDWFSQHLLNMDSDLARVITLSR